MNRARLTVEIVEEAGDWTGLDAPGLAEAVAGALSRHLPRVAGEATLALADDSLLRELNARFRGNDKPTNVLSFPSGDVPSPGAHLGDVIVSCDRLTDEAAAEGKSLDHHFSHLVLHGLLHLFGYDHESDHDADLMEQTEREILAGLGIDDPYAEPAPSGESLQESDA